jgi:hypothetical protein
MSGNTYSRDDDGMLEQASTAIGLDTIVLHSDSFYLAIYCGFLGHVCTNTLMDAPQTESMHWDYKETTLTMPAHATRGWITSRRIDRQTLDGYGA